MTTSTGHDTIAAGVQLGTIERRYGLMSSTECIVVVDVIARVGDLAVADRCAFLAAAERREAVAVVEQDGWFFTCTTERALTAADLPALRPVPGAPRLMSLASERGITPVLGPLVA